MNKIKNTIICLVFGVIQGGGAFAIIFKEYADTSKNRDLWFVLFWCIFPLIFSLLILWISKKLTLSEIIIYPLLFLICSYIVSYSLIHRWDLSIPEDEKGLAEGFKYIYNDFFHIILIVAFIINFIIKLIRIKIQKSKIDTSDTRK